MSLKKLLRSQARNKSVLITNIIDLSIGLTATVLLLVYVLHEWSYDRFFEKSDRIFRLNTIWIGEGNKSIEPINLRNAYTDVPGEVPGIDYAVQLYRGGSAEILSGESRFAGNNLLYADSTFFSIFNFKPVEGELLHSLNDPGSVVLTKSLAQKIFGTAYATGKIIELNGKVFSVSAVMEDVPLNSHLSFDFLVPMASLDILSRLQGLEFFTYYLLAGNVNAEAVTSGISEVYTGILKEKFSSLEWEELLP